MLRNRWVLGALVGLGMFALVGTVSVLWPNPFFIRMTPVGGWEVALLAVLSILAGLYVALRRPACSNYTATWGGVVGFLGVACPVCNKLLLLLFGAEVLLAYFEPVRLYVAGAGVAILAFALLRELRRARHAPSPALQRQTQT